MKKLLYHGSNKIIEKPIFGFGKPYNDYGLGFYCTENNSLAKEWAVRETENGYSNCYEIDTTNLSILNLNDNNYNMLNWLTILLQNREFSVSSDLALEGKEYLINNFNINYQDYDVIRGYRADDSYFSYALDFLNGTISYRKLCNAMKLGKIGEQFVLKSEKAFDSIKFINAEIANYREWFKEKYKRDSNARNDYFNSKKIKREKNDIFILNILNEEIKNDDPRLR